VVHEVHGQLFPSQGGAAFRDDRFVKMHVADEVDRRVTFKRGARVFFCFGQVRKICPS
jgi:hypothetical protein